MMVSTLIACTLCSFLATVTSTGIKINQTQFLTEHNRDEWTATSATITFPSTLAPGKTVGSAKYTVNVLATINKDVALATLVVYESCVDGRHSPEEMIASNIFPQLRKTQTTPSRLKQSFALFPQILRSCKRVQIKYVLTDDQTGDLLFSISAQFNVEAHNVP